ncbi:FtsW/RodA/SpoVE family cell cycle protein, partial [Streptococcus pyogenes]
QALTKGRWMPNRLNDWRVISMVFLILVATLPDLGNATIVALIIVIMLSVSGIGYRWFSTALIAIVSASTLLLGSIWLIGVDVV